MKIKSLFRAKRPLAGVLAFALLGSASSIRADEVYSQIVGAIAVSVPGNSDVVLSFPFKRSASFRGAVVGVSGDEVTVATDALEAGAFDGASYYVFVEESASDAMEGRRIDIESNTASLIDLGGEDLTGLAVDDVISVRAHWTLGDAFPDGFGSVEEQDPGGDRVVELMLPSASEGAGFAPETFFYFYGGDWREHGTPISDNASGTVLEPGMSFLVRNNGSEELKSYFFGEVVDAPLAIPLASDDDQVMDNFVGIGRPLGLTLDDLLGDGGPGIDDILGADDLLLVYDSNGGQNSVPTEYEYVGGQWQEVGSNVDAGATEIKAEQGIAIRRAPGSPAGYWVNEWSLPQ